MTFRPNFLIPTNLESPAAVPFWEGLRAGKFLAPRCGQCGELFFPPRSHCPECLGDVFSWEELSGKGTLYSWTELFFAQPEFDVPFFLALVDLAEGIGRIAARISAASADELRIGMTVRIRAAEPVGGVALYVAEPSKGSGLQGLLPKGS
jgi:uncharacterized OB-fold protein